MTTSEIMDGHGFTVNEGGKAPGDLGAKKNQSFINFSKGMMEGASSVDWCEAVVTSTFVAMDTFIG